MMGTVRRPSAEELGELIELTRRDPGSPAFVDLGEAYLALGRPREAVDVGASGLRASPHNIEGRMMVSRAFVALHQWKHAQAELLKVVKADRSHAPGFLLLGEVLMRRGDYERALPVLQHAQNLDPANPHLLDLLRRVRSRQPLDPPPPLPDPQAPLSSAPGMSPSAAPGAPTMAVSPFAEEEPTHVATPLGADMDMNAMGGQPMMRAAPSQRTVLQSPGGAAPRGMDPGYGPDPGYGADPGGYMDRGAPPPRQAAGMPGQSGVVRPRVLPAHKPKDAALAGLRQSAAVGENYLNNLLTAGLLDVPNIHAPEAPFELAPGARWGRSTRRVFVFLFILLFMGFGGGGAWYFFAKEQRDREVAEKIAKAEELMASASFNDLKAAVVEIQDALQRDATNTRAMASFGLATGLMSLLYGTPADEVDLALAAARRDIQAGQPGWRDMVLADVSATLATLGNLEDPKARLQDARNKIQTWIDANPDDYWAHWLYAMALDRAGERDGIKAALERAEAGGKGPVIATIALGDLMLDGGNVDEARKRYKDAIERAKDHPWAQIGMALASVEASTVEQDETLGTLNLMKDDQGPRVNSYRFLARAMALYKLEDYKQFSEDLGKAFGVTEPRFLSRLALAQLDQGKVKDAGEARRKILWYGDKEPTDDPLVAQLDAELLLARGLPKNAFQMVKKVDGLRAQRVRGQALFDQGDLSGAMDELEAAFEKAPVDLEVQVWREAARLAGGDRATRKEASAALDKLSRNSNNKLVRYAHGAALLRVGETADARRKLEESLDELTVEQPNPLAYRSHAALAQLDVASNSLSAAAQHVNEALEQVRGYLPALVIKARVLLLREEYREAAQAYQELLEEPEADTAEVELGYAEALVSMGQASEQVLEQARSAVRKAKEKDAPTAELARVAEKVDPALLAEFGLPAPRKR